MFALCPSFVYAYNSADTEISTVITVDGDFAEVVTTATIPPSPIEKKTIVFPLRSTATEVHFFINGNGQPLTLKTGKERLEQLFTLAKQTQNSQYFAFGELLWSHLYATEIAVKTPAITKFKYRIPLDFLDDIFYTQFPEDLGKITLVINRKNKITHFLPICDKAGEAIRTDNQIVWQGKCDTANFKFYFSEVPQPFLRYKTAEATYLAHFIDPKKTKNYHKFHFIIDQSGSMYGTKWQKTKVVVRAILENLPATDTVKIDFFDTTIQPFGEDFQLNTRENTKSILDYFDQKTPLGKADTTLVKPFPMNDAETVKIIISDNFTTNTNFSIDPWPKAPLVVLGFDDMQKTNNTATFSSGGFFFTLFESETFIKESDFLQYFKALHRPLSIDEIEKLDSNEKDFLPTKFSRFSPYISSILVSRSFEPATNITNTTATFLPQKWAKLRLADIWQTKPVLSETIKTAIASINQTFGLKVDDAFWQRSPLSTASISLFNDFTAPDIWGKTMVKTIKFKDHIPFYVGLEGAVQYNFQNLSNENNHFALKAYSEAQKQLFVNFPEIMAQPFSLMQFEGLGFCYHDWRCLTISSESENSLPRESDKLYWRNINREHWANSFIRILADKNIYQLTEDGDPLPDQKITRAEFVKMVVMFKYGRDFEPVETNQFFPDISEPWLREAVNLLVSKGVIQGYSDGTFRPDRILSRAEGVKILLSINGVAKPDNYDMPAKLSFSDLRGWPIFWVEMAKQQGLIQGYKDGRFGSHDALTRGQSAKLIVTSLESAP